VTNIQDNVPFGPSPEEYNYRCSQCRCELWVNEVIIDLEIGLAKFEGAYTAGFMPLLGCPSCNQKAMEHTGIKSPPEAC
jgi:hypothetical protein